MRYTGEHSPFASLAPYTLLFVQADFNNHLIRHIVVSSGTVTTLAGAASPNATDGVGAAARFKNPNGVAMDAAGAIAIVVSNKGASLPGEYLEIMPREYKGQCSGGWGGGWCTLHALLF